METMTLAQSLKHCLVGALVLLVAGCAPKPEDVCHHYMKIMENDAEKAAWMTSQEKCVERMETVKKRHGVNSYRREVDCALKIDTSYKLRTCIRWQEKKRSGKKF